MGFGVPTISPNPKPFAGMIPNVIALPYGKCPPFHIMAPSWRTLLKLMARLSGTRLEPTVEAMAVVKTEMRLRIVVSFVKVRLIPILSNMEISRTTRRFITHHQNGIPYYT